MKSVFKKILLILMFFLSTNLCIAAEEIQIELGNDYLITSDKNVKTTLIANPKIITLSPFFTIFNEKNVLLLHPERVGKTSFTIFLDKSKVIFNLTVKPKSQKPNSNTITKGCFEIMLLDAPPEIKKELK